MRSGSDGFDEDELAVLHLQNDGGLGGIALRIEVMTPVRPEILGGESVAGFGPSVVPARLMASTSNMAES